MSVSGPSPLGTLMVQRVEGALGVTVSQQANIATGARPDAVSQPGQADKLDPVKNPPPKESEAARRAQDQGGRQGGLAALARNDPEIAKLLAARNAPMTAYTASAPTTLGQAAKTILALLQQFPDARPAVTGRAPLFAQSPGQGATAGGPGGTPGPQPGAPGTGGGSLASGPAAANPIGGTLDPRAVEALLQRAAGDGSSPAPNTGSSSRAAAGTPGGAPLSPSASTTPGTAPGAAATTMGTTGTGLPLPLPTGMAGQLMMALSQAMQGSGLFYESHLKDFAFGQRSLLQLLSEPQAQAGQEAARNPGAEAGQPRGAGDAGSSSAAGQAAHASQAAHSSQAAHASQTAQSAGAHLAGALLGLDPSTHALVRQQLETLANQNFAWHGEAWPGSDMEWEVQRREPQGGDGQEAENWATRLKLNLPGLGEVQARLSLAGSQLVMHLVSPEGAEVMADHTELLRQRLTLQGMQLSQLTISRDEEGVNHGEPA